MTGPIEIPPASVVMCTYAAYCTNRATSHVWDETRPGLVIEEDVCESHLRSALRLGFREGQPPRVEAPEV